MKKQLIIAVCLLFSTIAAQAQIITTFAGNGTAGYSGDGGIATAAEFNNPDGICVDSAGNVYIADYFNACIRKVNTYGIITTIAGNGSQGYSGDGGNATNAQLHYPVNVCADNHGNLYINDWFNYRVRKVDPLGVITTFAGNGAPGYSGMGGPATVAQINTPNGVAIDNFGNVYISNASSNYISKVNTFGIITTFAGNGSAGYSGDGGQATSAQINNPGGIAIDPAGNLYIAASGTIRKVNTSGIITTVAGNGTPGSSGDGGPATSASVSPWTVSLDATGNIYFNDVGYYRTRKVNNAGIITTIAGNGTDGFSGDGGPATSAGISVSWGTAIDNSGNLYISDVTNNQRIRKVVLCPASFADSVTGLSSMCAGSTAMLFGGTSGGTWSSSNTGIAIIGSTGTVTGVTAGTAIISYTVTNACGTAAATKIITVNPLPNAGTITGSLSVCAGSITVLSETASGGTWLSSDVSVATVSSTGVIVGVASGAAIISYSVTNSCGTVVATTGNTMEQWTIKDSMPTVRHTMGAAVVGNIIYVIGGANYTTPENTNEAYNPATNTWATMAPMPTARGELGVATVNGKIYAIGGDPTGYSPTDIVEEYDPVGDTWTTKAPMPTARAIFSVGVVANKIYAVGGWPGGLNTVEEYDPSTDTWTTKAPLPVGMQQLNNCVAINGKLHFIGGMDGSATVYYSTHEVYDPVLNLWSTSTNLPFPRHEGAATVLNNNIYFLGGLGGTTSAYANYATNNYFDSTTSAWVNSLPMLNSRSAMIAATVNDKIYVIGGDDSSGTEVNWNHEYSVTTIPAAVTVNPTPGAGTITGASMACIGNTIALTNATSGGAWSSSNTSIATVGSTGIVTGVTAGTDTIRYSVTNTCGTLTATKMVSVNPLPDAGTISGADSVCISAAPITLSDAVSGGSWMSSNANATVTNGVVTGVAAGSDAIAYIVTNICGADTASHIVTVVLCPTEVNTIASKGNEVIAVYPNPNGGAFTFNLSADNDEEVQIVITNVAGEKVKELTATTNKLTDIQLHVSAGVYFLTATTAHGRYVVKVTVE